MTDSQFPGRWLGGTSLVLGPIALLTGVLLRVGPDFFFPEQLRAYADRPALMTAAYSCVLAGYVLLWPAIIVLAQRIGRVRPLWALWGCGLVVFGLFARTFHAGVDHLAFQLVESGGAVGATRSVADAYGAWHLMSALSVAIMAGWVVLAVGAVRAGALDLVRAVGLGCMALMPLGVLKGTTPLSVVAALGLAVGVVPLGVAVLREGPRPRRLVAGIAGMVLVVAGMALVGTLG
jgi:hypothetical protein